MTDDDDLNAQYRALTPGARLFSTGRPHHFYWAAGVVFVVFAALGIWIMTCSVVGGVVVIVLALASALGTGWPGRWSQKHPDQARAAVEIQRRRRNRLARRHPAYFLVLVPILVGGGAALRSRGQEHHPSVLEWLVPGLLGLVFALVVGVLIVYRARHTRDA